MITKNVNGITVNFINQLDEIKLEKMVEYHKVINDVDIDEIDRIIKMLTILSDTTEEVIENMDISEANSIFKEIMFDTEVNLEFENKIFKVENRQFKVKDRISVKDISLIKKCIAKGTDDFKYVYDIAAIFYKEILPDGNLKIDYSEEHLEEKANLFKENMTYDYILYHLNNLTNILNKELNVLG